MRILVVGKYPPIQGGVSAQTYWLSLQLAERGHDVMVITNAAEVERSYRIFMRPEDWSRCETRATSRGQVRVHWTKPLDHSFTHIPQHNPFVSKLVTLGLDAAGSDKVDAVFSFYLEPYAVAGDIIAQQLGVPHIVKTAGSDAGFLWRNPQLRAVYDGVFRRAAMVWTGTAVRDELVARCRMVATKIHLGGGGMVPDDLFKPTGEALDLEVLMDDIKRDPDWGEEFVDGASRPGLFYFGIYGKVAANKGVFDLLQAIADLKSRGVPAGLLVMGASTDRDLHRFRSNVERLGINDRIVRIPFLPYWRVPEFIRRCFAVCCLERDFPIEMHNPVIAREVLLSGVPLVASTEVLRKLPRSERLASGYNCVAVADAKNHLALANTLQAMTHHAALQAGVGRRAREYVLTLQRSDVGAAQVVEQLIARARRSVDSSIADSQTSDGVGRRQVVAQLLHRLCARYAVAIREEPVSERDTLNEVVKQLDEHINAGKVELVLYRDVAAVCSLLEALPASDYTQDMDSFLASVFRLRIDRWAISDEELDTLDSFAPTQVGEVRMYRFESDVNQIMAAIKSGILPDSLNRNESYLAIQSGSNGRRPRVFALDGVAAEIVQLACISSTAPRTSRDGAHPSSSSFKASLRELFARGVVGLRHKNSRDEVGSGAYDTMPAH